MRRIEIGPLARPPPDSTIALWNSPFASGEIMSALTDPPPADSPKIVTFVGSPPKAAMLLCTHSSARDLIEDSRSCRAAAVGRLLRQRRVREEAEAARAGSSR